MSNTNPNRISRAAIDSFVMKYTAEKNPSSVKKIVYTTADGKKVTFTPADAMIKGAFEYYQLLGQTYPYHERASELYPITDLAFVMAKNGQKLRWAGKPEDLTSLISIGVVCNFITLEEGSDANKVYIRISDKVKAVPFI